MSQLDVDVDLTDPVAQINPAPSSSQEQQRLSDEQTLPDRKVTRSRKHVTKACESCKRARAKCDGRQPCDRCTSRLLSCSYTNEEDRRTRGSTKRKLDQLERENKFLHELLRTLEHSSDAQVQQVVSIVRSNTSIDDMAAGLTRTMHDPKLTRQGSSRSEQTRSGSETNTSNDQKTPRRHEVFKVDRLTDAPLYEVSATPWTNVTHDNHLVSHLVSLWATWDNLFPDGVVLEYFLRDMQAGHTSSHFCSPFLVNCILAAGCLNSNYEETKTNDGKHSPILDQFLEEAKQHLEDDRSTSIANLQGVGILYLVLIKINRDREAWDYATQATNMCAEMLRCGERDRYLSSENSNSEQERAAIAYTFDAAIWGTFCATTMSYMMWQRPQILPQPPRPFPERPANILPEQKWMAYHGPGGSQDLFLDPVHNLHSSLAVLTREVSLAIFLDSDSLADKTKALVRIEKDLTAGYEAIPDYIKSSPAACYLRAWWLTIIGTVLLDEQYHGEWDAIIGRLRSIALEVVDICRLACSIADRSKISIFMCHSFYQSLLILMDQNSSHAYDDEIMELLVTFRAISQRSPWAVALLRMIQIDAVRRSFKLPEAALKLFDEFEKNDLQAWKDELQMSRYPYLDSFSLRCKEANDKDGLPTLMGDFLEKFDAMCLNGNRRDSVS
ncbi:hypothetical protein LTR64_004305 [Lithohypha guttulata]|uniref:uncharacterized protein n=1 Tax=Lithohypha guttulata TaxID=1690604 RepID=UPI002DDF8FA7|nr:hypothetical protein LTR51_006401 [Lithohypha guttulata]